MWNFLMDLGVGVIVLVANAFLTLLVLRGLNRDHVEWGRIGAVAALTGYVLMFSYVLGTLLRPGLEVALEFAWSEEPWLFILGALVVVFGILTGVLLKRLDAKLTKRRFHGKV